MGNVGSFLLDNEIAFGKDGKIWFATQGGVSQIEYCFLSLQEKHVIIRKKSNVTTFEQSLAMFLRFLRSQAIRKQQWHNLQIMMDFLTVFISEL